MVLVSPLALNAFVARLEAWLNLSHRENARVFVTVRTMAMTEQILGRHTVEAKVF